MASTYLYRAASGSVTSQTTFTFSFWIKRCSSGAGRVFMHENAASHTSKFDLHFDSNDKWNIGHYDGSSEYNVKTDMVFRDFNAWYHIVTRVDTTQSTEADRYRIYVNGNQVNLTEISAGYPPQNFNINLGAKIIVYGRYQAATPSSYFDGYLSHCHYADGQSYAPTVFGSTDTTTGEWKIDTSPSVNYGSNGHFMFKNDNSLNDDSGQGNNFTLGGGTLTKSEDCPSNVFCTWNPLARGDLTNNATLSNGNTYYSSDQSGYNIRAGTLGANKGKFYWEGKFISHNPQTSPGMPLGIIADNIPIGTNIAGGQAPYYYSYTYDGSNGSVTYNSSGTNYGTTILDTIGQIGMVAMDLDNNKVYFGVNGVWTNSANPSNGTGGYSIIDPADTPLGFYLPAVSDRSSIREYVYAWNFGNGYFGTTAVSSAGTNASNNGIFEYDVPSGFTALSTKGLNL